jgi:phasin family protein
MSESTNTTPNYQASTAKARETVEKTVKAGQAATEKAAKAAKETAEKAYTAGTQALSKAYDQAAGVTKDTIVKTFPQAAASFEAFAGFQRANIEALVAAGSTAMRGVEEISQQVLAYNTKAMEDGFANTEKLLGCKSMPEALETQTQCAMAQMQSALAHGSKLADLTLKLAGEVAEPVQARVAQAAEMMGKPLTA